MTEMLPLAELLMGLALFTLAAFTVLAKFAMDERNHRRACERTLNQVETQLLLLEAWAQKQGYRQ